MYAQPFNRLGSYLRAIQERFRRWLTFVPVFFYGRGIFQNTFGFMPFRSKITTVGKDFKLFLPRKSVIHFCSLQQIARNHLQKLKSISIFWSDRWILWIAGPIHIWYYLINMASSQNLTNQLLLFGQVTWFFVLFMTKYTWFFKFSTVYSFYNLFHKSLFLLMLHLDYPNL